MPNVQELFREMNVIGYCFEMRSDEDYNCGDQFVWAGLSLRVTSKRSDDGAEFVRHWPWRFMYGFEVLATDETPGVRRGSL